MKLDLWQAASLIFLHHANEDPMAVPKPPVPSSMVQPKSRTAETGPAEMPEAAEVEEAPPRPAGPVDLKTMQVRVNRAGWVEMSRLAQDLDVPLEALMVEAYNDVLVKHGKPPVVERRQPVKKDG